MSTLLRVMLVLPCALWLACPQRPQPVDFGKVFVDSSHGADGLVLEAEFIRSTTVQSVRGLQYLRHKPKSRGVLRVRVMAGRVPPGPDGLPTVVLRLELQTRDSKQQPGVFHAGAETRGATRNEHPEPLIEAALRQGLAGLEQQIRLVSRPTAEVCAALVSDDTELQEFALSLLAARRDKSAYESVERLLQGEEDAALVLRAVGTLVALGDERAVRALTDLTHRKGSTFVRQIVFAVGNIGGREAEAYLFTVASGHPDETVQDAARQALQELRERSAGARLRETQEGS